MKQPRSGASIFLKLSLLTLLIFSGGGCTTLKTKKGVPIDLTKVKSEEQTTHYGTILRDLGPPDKLSALPNGFAFLYEYIVITEFQVGILLDSERTLGITVFPESAFDFRSLFRFGFAQGHAERQVLLLTFDGEGRLVAQRYEEFDQDLGRGTGIQTFIGISSLVDNSHLEEEESQHNWGMSLLRPLHQTLNDSQSLETGISGLEQTGTPTGIGQHTLELRE